MKTFRILMIAAFLLGLVIMPAQAQEAVTGQTVYVALPIDGNSGLPVYTQARQAFDRIAPKLLDAKRSGVVQSLTPDLNAAVVQIQLAPGANQAALPASLSVYSDLREAVRNLPNLPLIRKPGTTTLSAAPYFYISLYSSCFYGGSLSPYYRVVGSLRNSSGVVLSVSEGTVDSDGYLSDCFYGAHNLLYPGYKVVFKVFNGATLVSTYVSGGAPTITFSAVDKVNSIVRGVGPASRSYRIYGNHRNLNSLDNAYFYSSTGTTTSTGAWAKDLGTVPFRGGDDIEIDFSYGTVTFYRYFTVPYSYCMLGDNYCSMYAFQNQAVSMTVRHGGVNYSKSGRASLTGWFYNEPVNSYGNPVYVTVGDLIYGTGLTTWTPVTTTAAINYSTNVVTGRAPASKSFESWVYVSSSGYWYRRWVTANSTGVYGANYTSSIDLLPTSAYVAEVYFINSATGNAQDMYKAFTP